MQLGKRIQILCNNPPPGQRSKGGTVVAIKKDMTHKRLNIRKGTRTVCSIYQPSTDQVTEEDMRELLEQLPAPMILLGDFNAHNPLWGSEKISTRGKIMKKIEIQPLVH